MHSPNRYNARTASIAVLLLLLPFALACATAKPKVGVAEREQIAGQMSGKLTEASMANHQHMAGMSMPITVPPGALYTTADVEFMQGMIAHHAQAIHMSRLAAARGVNPRVLRFAMKIDQSQRAEIVLMQEWLVANRQMAPDTNSFRTMMMVGMLTPAQLTALEATKGAAFDRQFLVLMIQHHQGALRMVADLLATPRAAQDVDISVFANDVEVVQTAEIAVMQQMLADL